MPIDVDIELVGDDLLAYTTTKSSIAGPTNARIRYIRTPLREATRLDNILIARLLLENGAASNPWKPS